MTLIKHIDDNKKEKKYSFETIIGIVIVIIVLVCVAIFFPMLILPLLK